MDKWRIISIAALAVIAVPAFAADGTTEVVPFSGTEWRLG